MSVLHFSKIFQKDAEKLDLDWSTQEVADFYRAYHLLQQNGVSIGMDRGLTDIGEPWLVFYDTVSQDVFLHIARIGNTSLLVSEQLELRLKARTVSELLLKLEDTVKGFVEERSKNASNVVMHPAARMIMAVSAVFLLFKLDGDNSAIAKEFESLDSSLDNAHRKIELSLMARAQAALTRLVDMAENPASAAVLASAILATEIARIGNADDNKDSVRIESVETAAIPYALEFHGNNEHVAAIHTAAIEGIPTDLSEMEQAQQAALIEVVGPQVYTQLKDLSVESLLNTVSNVRVPIANDGFETLQKLGTSADVSVSDDLVASSGVEKSVPADFDQAAPIALSTIKTLLDISGSRLDDLHVINLKAQDSNGPEVSQLVDMEAGDQLVPVAVADEIDYSFSSQTTLNPLALISVLQYLLKNLEDVAVRFESGNVIIEQAFGHDSAEDIGIWTNTMNDGSTISVVGLADIVDDVAFIA